MVRIVFICLLLTGSLAFAQTPMDVGSIELLIDRHKKQHDLLEDRNKLEAQHNSVSALTKDIAQKYEKLHKELSSKYNLASQWFNLGVSAIDLLGELKSLKTVIPKFLRHANKVTNPYVLYEYLRAGKKIKSELEFCIKVATHIPTLRLNAKELHEIVELLKEKLYRIRYILSSYAMAISGQVEYNKLYEPITLPDYAKIASDITKEYFKQ